MARVETINRNEEWLMTNEEMQRMMEFILEQEAKSSAKIDALTDAQKGAEERWTRSEERWTRTEEGIRALLSIAEIHEREIEGLGENIAAVSENGRAVDNRLAALIDVVERRHREGHNLNS